MNELANLLQNLGGANGSDPGMLQEFAKMGISPVQTQNAGNAIAPAAQAGNTFLGMSMDPDYQLASLLGGLAKGFGGNTPTGGIGAAVQSMANQQILANYLAQQGQAQGGNSLGKSKAPEAQNKSALGALPMDVQLHLANAQMQNAINSKPKTTRVSAYDGATNETYEQIVDESGNVVAIIPNTRKPATQGTTIQDYYKVDDSGKRVQGKQLVDAKGRQIAEIEGTQRVSELAKGNYQLRDFGDDLYAWSPDNPLALHPVKFGKPGSAGTAEGARANFQNIKDLQKLEMNNIAQNGEYASGFHTSVNSLTGETVLSFKLGKESQKAREAYEKSYADRLRRLTKNGIISTDIAMSDSFLRGGGIRNGDLVQVGDTTYQLFINAAGEVRRVPFSKGYTPGIASFESEEAYENKKFLISEGNKKITPNADKQ